MARIIYSGLVSEIKGSIAGTTFQSNRYGYTIKSKPRSVIPSSSRQFFRKQQLQAVMRLWAGLTQGDRDAWNAYATTYPQPSKNNPAAYLNGFNLFLRVYLVNRLSDSSFTLAQPTAAPVTIPLADPTLNYSGTDLYFGMENDSPDDDLLVQIFLSRAIGAGQSYIKTWTRYIKSFTWTAIKTDDIINSHYVAVFGALPAIGDIVACDITVYLPSSGQVVYLPSLQITVT